MSSVPRGPLPGRSALAALVVSALAVAGCAHRIEPTPSAAIEAVHQRLAARAATPPPQGGACEGQPAELSAEVSFVYGKPDLDDSGRGQLAEAKAWLACHPAALVTVAAKVEHHYRNPDLEQALTAQRSQAVVDDLKAAGIPAQRILQVSPVDDALTVPSARLRLVANGNGF
jgi:outer membrane protein OmpA-like peptidoglycan-associated protein